MKKDSNRDIFVACSDASEELFQETVERICRRLAETHKDLRFNPLPNEQCFVHDIRHSRLTAGEGGDLSAIVGSGNVSVNRLDRVRHAAGRSVLEIIRTRQGLVKACPEAVIYPGCEPEIERILAWCRAHNIAVVSGGGYASVARGNKPSNRTIALDLQRMDRILGLNETNRTVTVESGLTIAQLESRLNESGYTTGYLSRTIEQATLCGLAAACGSGQGFVGNGKFKDVIMGCRLAAPRMTMSFDSGTHAFTGPDASRLILGSEGTFGVITGLTLRIRKQGPEKTVYGSFLFDDFTTACKAAREIMQSGCGRPTVFRLFDPVETDWLFYLGGTPAAWRDKIMRYRGYRPGRRSLLVFSVEETRSYNRMVKKNIQLIAGRHNAMSLGAKPARNQIRNIFREPRLRDSLMDAGVIVDTLETEVCWDKLCELYRSVRNFAALKKIDAVKAGLQGPAGTVVLAHLSHIPRGDGIRACFTFLYPAGPTGAADHHEKFLKQAVSTIRFSGGSMHDPGHPLTSRLRKEMGEDGRELFRAVKHYFDPDGIMNPGKSGP